MNIRQEIINCLNYFGPQTLDRLIAKLQSRQATNAIAIREAVDQLTEHGSIRISNDLLTSRVHIGGLVS